MAEPTDRKEAVTRIRPAEELAKIAVQPFANEAERYTALEQAYRALWQESSALRERVKGNERDAHRRGWNLALLNATRICDKKNTEKAARIGADICALDYDTVIRALAAGGREGGE